MASDCLFCRIARGEIPVTRVAENDRCVAFRDINPQAPTHVLVIPREHMASLDEASDPVILGEVLLMAQAVARHEGLVESGYRTVLNTNAGAGQSVFHLHAHVLGGRPMTWPPG